MYSSNELKKGVIIDVDGAPHIVENTQAASGGARGGTTTYHPLSQPEDRPAG